MKLRGRIVAAAFVALVVAFVARGSWGEAGAGRAQGPERPAAIGAVGELGFIIKVVEPGSPAERAGLRPGDIVTLWGGRQVESVEEMWGIVRGSLGKPVEITYLRYDTSAGVMREQRVTVTPVPAGSWKTAAE